MPHSAKTPGRDASWIAETFLNRAIARKSETVRWANTFNGSTIPAKTTFYLHLLQRRSLVVNAIQKSLNFYSRTFFWTKKIKINKFTSFHRRRARCRRSWACGSFVCIYIFGNYFRRVFDSLQTKTTKITLPKIWNQKKQPREKWMMHEKCEHRRQNNSYDIRRVNGIISRSRVSLQV